LEIANALIPPWPGANSAVGCVTADVRHDFVQTINQRLDILDIAGLYRILEQHAKEGEDLIIQERIDVESVEAHFYADMSYYGQIHEIRTPLPNRICERDEIKMAFEETYAALYGQAIETLPIRIMTLRTTVVGIRTKTAFQLTSDKRVDALEGALKEKRAVYFNGGFQECQVFDRTLLPRDTYLLGPAIIEQADATTVVEPSMRCDVDALGNLKIKETK
jgi:N-methylhydantoinase A